MLTKNKRVHSPLAGTALNAFNPNGQPKQSTTATTRRSAVIRHLINATKYDTQQRPLKQALGPDV